MVALSQTKEIKDYRTVFFKFKNTYQGFSRTTSTFIYICFFAFRLHPLHIHFRFVWQVCIFVEIHNMKIFAYYEKLIKVSHS